MALIVRVNSMIIGLIAAAALALPAVAGAKVYAPPGKSGASEYAEVVPTPGGNVRPPSGTAGSSQRALAHLGHGAAGARSLGRLGNAGRSAANFARATAPSSQAGLDRSLRRLERDPGGSALGGLARLVAGDDAGGIGLLMPLLLGLSLLAAMLFGAFGLRRRHGSA